jgi:bifunctional DNA-binding transcriptional regulator/antitoxin component of YhaV-PrlF toxin-antitoxin module
MRLALLALAAARPHSDGSGDSSLIGVTCVAAAIVLLVVGAFVRSHARDRRLHDGVSSGKRRRVLRSGTATTATVLSSRRFEPTGWELPTGVPVGRNQIVTSLYSIVYEVALPNGGTFRAKGVEDMPSYYHPDHEHMRREFELQPGDKVAVKYDPVDHTTVLVDPYQKMSEVDRLDAKKDQSKEAARGAEERRERAKEARLMRGDPPV